MNRKLFCIGLGFVLGMSTLAFSQPALTFDPMKGRIALDHDGNCYDDDDIGALATNWMILSAFGMQKKLVFIGHSDNACHNYYYNKALQAFAMDSVARGFRRYPGFDSACVFDYEGPENELTRARARFVAEANKSTVTDRLYYICAGPMQIPYKNIEAVDQAKRKYITVISHSTWNENFNDCGKGMTWSSMKSAFEKDGTIFTHIADQNGEFGGGANWDWEKTIGTRCADLTGKDSTIWKKNCIDSFAFKWTNTWSIKGQKRGDVSDAGMVYYLMTGNQNGKVADIKARCEFPHPMWNPGSTTVSINKSATSLKNTPGASIIQQGSTLLVQVSGMQGNGSVALYDMLSRAVCTGHIADGRAVMAIGRQPAGVYLAKIQTGNVMITRKMVLK